MKTEHLSARFVDEVPRQMEPGLLYVSIEYATCAHLCACGCGDEVWTPLSPAQWELTYDGENVSLWPSVGSWTLPCHSHYVIERGQTRPSRRFTDAEIAANRRRDRSALDRMTSRGRNVYRPDLPDGGGSGRTSTPTSVDTVVASARPSLRKRIAVAVRTLVGRPRAR